MIGVDGCGNLDRMLYTYSSLVHKKINIVCRTIINRALLDEVISTINNKASGKLTVVDSKYPSSTSKRS